MAYKKGGSAMARKRMKGQTNPSAAPKRKMKRKKK